MKFRIIPMEAYNGCIPVFLVPSSVGHSSSPLSFGVCG